MGPMMHLKEPFRRFGLVMISQPISKPNTEFIVAEGLRSRLDELNRDAKADIIAREDPDITVAKLTPDGGVASVQLPSDVVSPLLEIAKRRGQNSGRWISSQIASRHGSMKWCYQRSSTHLIYWDNLSSTRFPWVHSFRSNHTADHRNPMKTIPQRRLSQKPEKRVCRRLDSSQISFGRGTRIEGAWRIVPVLHSRTSQSRQCGVGTLAR